MPCYNKGYPNVAKAMKPSYSRQQGCSCSRLPQKLDNEEDEGFMAFPKGKNFNSKKMNTGNHLW